MPVASIPGLPSTWTSGADMRLGRHNKNALYKSGVYRVRAKGVESKESKLLSMIVGIERNSSIQFFIFGIPESKNLSFRRVLMPLSFEKDIRPLFRDDPDVSAMKDYGLDLSSYSDVKAKAQSIHTTLLNGSMPCDGGWPADRVTLFKKWMDEGMAP